MKKKHKEKYSFRITVIKVRNDCRNGHEAGDTYVCEYGCPKDFCSKSIMKLFPYMEVVRSDGDLRNIRWKGTKNTTEFWCPDNEVLFKFEGMKKI